jgi:tetratricopeptide (TPR) repeat protein
MAAVVLVAWLLYGGMFADPAPGDFAYQAASKYFADGGYEQALAEYEDALRENPAHLGALAGKAAVLVQLKRERDAIAIYDRLIATQQEHPGHYANRGIAHDRLNQHESALADYEIAISLDPEIGDGPGWLTRFLRNEPEPVPGIADRAEYIRSQLALPPPQRVLRVPKIDEAQRPYKK